MSVPYPLVPHNKQSLLKAIENKPGLETLISLKDRDAEVALERLQEEVDNNSSSKRGDIMKVMKMLSKRSGQFPHSYWLHGIKLGEHVNGGGFGDVYKGDFCDELVAVKFARYFDAKNNADKNSRLNKHFLHEVILWRQLSHPNIIPLLGLYREGPRKGMVSKWQRKGNLLDYLESFPNADRHTLLIQAANGLVYLHGQVPPVVHLDLKPENILISDDCIAMLADFGLARMKHSLSGWSSSVHGWSEYYVSPEVLNGNIDATVSSDIWSFGMVVYVVFTGSTPYQEYPNPIAAQTAIRDAKPPQKPPHTITDMRRGFTNDVWGFLEKYCWEKIAQKRPSARVCSGRLEELRVQWSQKKYVTSSPTIHLPEEAQYMPDNSLLHSIMERFNIKIEVSRDSARLKLQGEKECLDAAETEIRDSIEALREKATQIMSIPAPFHGWLIGENGERVKTMEQQYSVKIHYKSKGETVEITGAPRNISDAQAQLKSEIETCRLMQVSQSGFNYVQFNWNKIKSTTKLEHLSTVSESRIYMRGSTDALERGEAFLREWQAFDETTPIPVERQALILLRQIYKEKLWFDMVVQCGGPLDSELQKRLIIWTREEGPAYLRGDPVLVQALRDALIVEAERRKKVVIGMKVSRDLHRDLLLEHHINHIHPETYIIFPNKPDYDAHEIEDILGLDADPQDVVKILGTRKNCEIAKKGLKKLIAQENRLRWKAELSSRLHYDIYKLAIDELKSKDIRITLSPPKPCVPLNDWSPPPLPPSGSEPSWERHHRYKNEGIEHSNFKCTWLLRAKTETDLEEGVAIVKEAINRVYYKSWEGRLTFPNEFSFGRIIGSGGENLKRLQEDTDTNITVPKPGEGTTIVIIGPETGIEQAKNKILQLQWRPLKSPALKRLETKPI